MTDESALPTNVGSNDGLDSVTRMHLGCGFVAELLKDGRIAICDDVGGVHMANCGERSMVNEIRRLHSALRSANAEAEKFERLWYLAKEDADRYAFAKTLEGQVVTVETFKNRSAAELDQELDDAMPTDWLRLMIGAV